MSWITIIAVSGGFVLLANRVGLVMALSIVPLLIFAGFAWAVHVSGVGAVYDYCMHLVTGFDNAGESVPLCQDLTFWSPIRTIIVFMMALINLPLGVVAILAIPIGTVMAIMRLYNFHVHNIKQSDPWASYSGPAMRKPEDPAYLGIVLAGQALALGFAPVLAEGLWLRLMSFIGNIDCLTREEAMQQVAHYLH